MKSFTTLLAMASAASAHMIMKSPVPHSPPDNGPLDKAGADFPCKFAGGSGKIQTTNVNKMTIGSSNPLSFTGSAVHGGGSCQVSLAKGTDISKSTKWMVIHSIEGGCPADAAGNLGDDPNGSGAATFQFTVPDHPDLGPGDYTLAWTWNNKVGNREFYMNCAYVQLSGAAKKRYAPSQPISKRADGPLPDMFVSNIGNGCSTKEGIDVQYPNPGSSLEVGKNAVLGKPDGSCGASGASGPSDPAPSKSSIGAGSGATSSVVASSSAVGNTVIPTTTGVSAAQPSSFAGGAKSSGLATVPQQSGQRTQSSGNVFATVSASGTQAAPTAAATSAAVATSAAAPTQSASPAAPIGSGTSTGSQVQGISMNFAYNQSSTPGKRDLRSHIARRRHSLHGSTI
ncbi:hypothetical protein LTR05_002440 [Lithohypha guttulata]|uniref:Lytic polysaccharide monooxygenase n=1 Tax=Lithohypha guttulata TaxID=1690604 RepID=A0AAN7T462_9EURO|nr:hypothetical protein LTR05_002440 [Lithohypha guttulata]